MADLFDLFMIRLFVFLDLLFFLNELFNPCLDLFIKSVGMHNRVDDFIILQDFLHRELDGKHFEQFVLNASQSVCIFGIDAVDFLNFILDLRHLYENDCLHDPLLELFGGHLEVNDLDVGQQLHGALLVNVAGGVKVHAKIGIDGDPFLSDLDFIVDNIWYYYKL